MLKKLGIPFYLAAAMLIVGILFVQRVPQGKTMLLQKDLLTFGEQIGDWKCGPHQSFEQSILNVLRVDDYLNRNCSNRVQAEISLYVGYFRNQISGQTNHSPLNCMPGSGWNFTDDQIVTFKIDGPYPVKIEAHRAMLLSTDQQRLLMYYWYQGRGRFLASEYWEKIYLVLDAIRYNRTDGALVRVLAQLPKEGNIEGIDAQVKDFIVTFTPILQYEYFPKPVGS